MKTLILFAVVFGCGWLVVDSGFAQGTAFTYQGRLNDGAGPANGTYDLRLLVYDSSSGGSILGGPITNLAVPVTNGLFTVLMDFGPGVFTGASNWLHIGVRTNGGGSFTALSPRQQLTPTPYAIFAEGANAAGLTGTIPSADLGGTYANAITLNNAANVIDGNGSGLTSLNASQLASGTVPDARLSGNVAFLNKNQTFVGNNTFAGPGQSLVVNTGPISTSLFTGLGLQYYTSTGEGAILSSYNDGYGFLSFYTKAGTGFPITREMMIDKFGVVSVDQGNYNSGFLNNGNTNGAGLTFGTGSGEGIASKRTAGGNQYGLDFYTGFANRMSLNNAGNLELNQNDLYLFGGNNQDDGLGHRNSVSSQPLGGSSGGAFLWGFDGGGLGTVFPDEVSLIWDFSGNVWISNRLTVNGEFAVVNGLGGVQCYIGDDGAGNDVQIGSLKSGVTAVACYNATDNAYMHLYCSSISIQGGADLAEPFQISAPEKDIPEGSVVVIDDLNPGRLKLSDRPYDTRVAGVVSGANGIHPGIQMQQQGTIEGGRNVALTGRVYVLADAAGGAIRPGDLLTTSTTPGHAMRVSDHAKASGAILGKAMTGLSEGRGMVLVLVTLQ